jgi:hypothetical protein
MLAKKDKTGERQGKAKQGKARQLQARVGKASRPVLHGKNAFFGFDQTTVFFGKMT